jgi:hypothetical protein
MHKLRTLLEWFSMPLFALLIIHMSGHGFFLLTQPTHDHQHGHDLEHIPESDTSHTMFKELTETLFTQEVFIGILCFLLFVLVWHQKPMRKLVPCRHTHCSHTAAWPHLFAMFAFVIHFFPEAHLRAQMLQNPAELLSLAGLIAFGLHFLVDIIVGTTLSLYWPQKIHKIFSSIFLLSAWGGAFVVGQLPLDLPIAEGLILFIGAFFMAMFVHWPSHTK